MVHVEIQSLTKKFGGVVALDHVSLSFPKGKITGIIGPNGSGKSTLVHALSGVVPFDSGKIIVNGRTLQKLDSCDMPSYGVTRTFQEVRLFEQMTVLDNILVVLTARGVLAAFRERNNLTHQEKAHAVLTEVGLIEKQNARASTLSYGQRKLLEIARVLAMDTPVMLFDEPFAGLFKNMVTHVADILKMLRDAGKTIILVEHNMELIRSLCDYLIVLDSGVVLAEGEPNAVLRRKAVIEAYLGA